MADLILRQDQSCCLARALSRYDTPTPNPIGGSGLSDERLSGTRDHPLRHLTGPGLGASHHEPCCVPSRQWIDLRRRHILPVATGLGGSSACQSHADRPQRRPPNRFSAAAALSFGLGRGVSDLSNLTSRPEACTAETITSRAERPDDHNGPFMLHTLARCARLAASRHQRVITFGAL